MRRPLFLVALPLAAVLAGCSSPTSEPIREIPIHIGYSADRTQQYVEPKEIAVRQGERVRLVITNDDAAGAPDGFHDIAFRYANYGLIEHEVPAAKTTRTCIPDAEPETTCAPDKSYIVASQRGRFKMYCEVGPLSRSNADGTPQTRHEQMGMWGTLVVT
jgi:plastocyanin